MRIVAVTRALNEDDVIEAMIRHHAPMVDMHIVLDNGSCDRTLDILRSLKEEGLAVQVFQNESAVYAAAQNSTLLYRLAADMHAADWVLFLDADEFVDLRDVGDLRGYLEAIPSDVSAFMVRMVSYDAPSASSGAELNVTRRLVRRAIEPSAIRKAIVRGGITTDRIAIAAGNHGIVLDGTPYKAPHEQRLLLAHYPNRAPFQFAAKAATGRLKVLAAGESVVAQGWGGHYTEVFDSLKRRPGQWIAAAEGVAARLVADDSLSEDPLAYRGGELKYTEPTDYTWRFIRVLANVADGLAQSHGRILERNEGVREKAYRDLFGVKPVI